MASSSRKLHSRLYKSLLRLGKNFDKSESAKALVYRKNADEGPPSNYYQAILDRILHTGSYIFQYGPHRNLISFAEIVRQEFRRTDYDDIHTENERVDGGFTALRKFSTLWTFFESTVAQHKSATGKENEGGSPSADPYPCPHPHTTPSVLREEPMCRGRFLVAHPMVHGSMHRAVVLIIEHKTEGSYGIIVNKQTDLTLAEVVKGLPQDILDVFSHSKLSFGGPIKRLQYIHPFPEGGGVPLPFCSSQLYAGGHNVRDILGLLGKPADEETQAKDASTTVDDSSKDDGDIAQQRILGVKLFVGCCTWSSGAIEREIASGFWIPVACPPDVVLGAAAVGSSLPWAHKALGAVRVDEEVGVALRVSSDILQEQSDSSNSSGGLDSGSVRPLDMWDWIMSSLGKPYSEVAKLPEWVDTSTVESID